MKKNLTTIWNHFIKALKLFQIDKRVLSEKARNTRFATSKHCNFSMLLILSLLLGFLNPQPVQAAALIVTNLNDSGPGSLRQALADAASGDSITFGVTGTITITSGELVLDKSLSITGPVAEQVIISGNNSFRIFNISNAAATINISNLTITNGKTSGTGGGIFNTSRHLEINNVTFSNNSAERGGGMYEEGDTILTNVTFSGNSADYGGGMYIGSGTPPMANPQLINVTFSGNEAKIEGGGIYLFYGYPSVKNTILANNTAGSSGADVYCDDYRIMSDGYNLIEDRGGCVFFPEDSDIIGQDPLLAELADNGGSTQTHALLTGSPAIDQIPEGSNGCGSSLTEDQRGIFRPSPTHGFCDIGSYEYLYREIDLLGNNLSIENGDTTPDEADDTDFGDLYVDAGTVSHTFTIKNTGTAELVLNSITLRDVSTGAVDNLKITAQPAASISSGETTTFEITFNPVSTGVFSASVVMESSSLNENPYTFTIQGTGLPADPPMVLLGGDSTFSEPNVMLAEAITHLSVEFSKDVYNPAFSTEPDDVTNPANYLLIQTGANGAYDTVSCAGGLAGDDVQIPTGSVSYTNDDTYVARVIVNEGIPLPVGEYRLFVCGTTSILDMNGIALAGDGVNSGTDWTTTYTVTAFSVAEAVLPDTGFAQGIVTNLTMQPAEQQYTGTDLTLEIPALHVDAPIDGVPFIEEGWDVSWLRDHVGYLEGSAFPTLKGNTVLTGHVWDATNVPGIFADLKSLKYGDQIMIHAWGVTYTYEVRENRRISTSNVKTTFQHEELDWITLVTCEDYQTLWRKYSSRRVVRAVLMNVK